MTKIILSQDETSLLSNYFKTSPIQLIRLKSQVMVMRSKEMTIKEISSLVFKKERTVSRWIRDFSQRRMASIFSGHVDNENASKLTREQKRQIKEILQRPPSEYELPKAFWDVPILKKYIEAKFGIIYESVQSYHFLLKFSQLSFKYPDKFSYARNESLITKRMEDIREATVPYLKDNDWEVFAADEVRVVLEALTRRAWLKQGERTVIKVKRSREYQSYFGALNQKTNRCHIFAIDWQNQDEIIKALNQLIEYYPDKRLCIIWDNAAFHKGKKIRQALERSGSLKRIHLINLPPYAPDMNPIEHVWNTVKQQLSNVQFTSFAITKARFTEKINTQLFAYKI